MEAAVRLSDPYQDPPAYRWRQCGLAPSRETVAKADSPWEYVVTVRPVVEDDASKPWTLSADLYAVDVVLRHEAEGSFADTMSMRELLDFLESDQGVSLTVREALALLRVGTRAASHQVALDRSAAWAPSRVAVEPVDGASTALTVETRALADGSLLTFTMPSLRVGALAAPGIGLPPLGIARRLLQPKLAADAASAGARFGGAAAAREAEALDAALRCAEAARAAVSALEQHFSFGDAGSAGPSRQNARKTSLACSSPPRPAPPPANARRLKRDAAEAAARVEALAAAAARRAAGEEMGADEDPRFRFTGVGSLGHEDPRTTTASGHSGEKTDGGKNAVEDDADKRRRVGGGGLRLKAHVRDAGAGAKEKG